jgi:membrane protease YdiL (CAAX protease family)
VQVSKLRLSFLFVAAGRLRTGWRVALYLVCYLVGLFAVQVPIAVIYVGHLVLAKDEQGLAAALQPSSYPLWFLLLLKVGELALLLSLTYAFGRWLDKRRFVAFGFRPGRSWRLELLLGLALGAAQMGVIFGVTWAGGWLSVGWLDGAALVRGLAQGVLAAALFALGALGEEVMFRGYLQVNLQEGSGPLLALLLSSLLFGIFHIMNPSFGWLPLVNIVLAGLAMGCARLATGNLWLPIAYHFAWNFFQGAVLALPVSGMRYGGLLAVTDVGTRPWLTGAAFGPEGGLVGTVALLTAFPVFWLWGRWRRSL